jgi:hypothetical protein
MKTIVTGNSGDGKTFFVSTIVDSNGGPIFFMPVEEGAKGMCPDASPAGFRRGDTWLAPRDLPDFYDMLDAFLHEVNVPVDVEGPDGKPVKRRPYRHLGVDSLTGLERLVHQSVCQIEQVGNMEAKEYGKVWRAAVPVWQGVQNKLDEIRRSGVNLWIIAHATESIDASDTGQVFRKQDIMLSGSGKTLVEAQHLWRGWTDNVFFLLKKVKVTAGSKTTRAMAKLGGRVIVTTDNGRIYAKTRHALPPEIPATWPDLQRALKAGMSVKPAEVQKQVAAILPKLEPDDAALISADLALAKSPSQLAAVLSRAQGMLLVDLDDEAPEEEPKPAPTKQPQYSEARPHPLSAPSDDGEEVPQSARPQAQPVRPKPAAEPPIPPPPESQPWADPPKAPRTLGEAVSTAVAAGILAAEAKDAEAYKAAKLGLVAYFDANNIPQARRDLAVAQFKERVALVVGPKAAHGPVQPAGRPTMPEAAAPPRTDGDGNRSAVSPPPPTPRPANGSQQRHEQHGPPTPRSAPSTALAPEDEATLFGKDRQRPGKVAPQEPPARNPDDPEDY